MTSVKAFAILLEALFFQYFFADTHRHRHEGIVLPLLHGVMIRPPCFKKHHDTLDCSLVIWPTVCSSRCTATECLSSGLESSGEHLPNSGSPKSSCRHNV